MIAEYLYDARDEEVEILPEGVSTAAPITPFDNDIFFGSRLAFNDIQDSKTLLLNKDKNQLREQDHYDQEYDLDSYKWNNSAIKMLSGNLRRRNPF